MKKLIRLVINIVDIIEEALRLNGIAEREKRRDRCDTIN